MGNQEATRWLTPGSGGIGVASLLSDLGHEVPTSLLPAFLTSTLGAPASALGLIEGLADAAAGAAKFAGGPLADDPHRRRTTAVTGYLATAGLSAAIGGATAVWQVGVLRTGAWTARGIRGPSRNALLADTVDRAAYGRAYGFERAMDNLGAVGGPLLAIALVAAVGVRTAIWISVVPGVLAAIAIVFAIRHIESPTDRARAPLRFRVRPVLAGGRTWLFAGVGAFELGNAAATLLILRATDQLTGPLGSSGATRLAVVLYAGYNLTATVVSLGAGQVSDRLHLHGPRVVFVSGALAFLVAYALFAANLTTSWSLAVPFILAGVGIGCAETAQHASVALAVPDQLRGSSFGLLAAIQSLGNLGASAIAGLIWTFVGPSAAFAYLGFWMLVAIVVLSARGGRVAAGSP